MITRRACGADTATAFWLSSDTMKRFGAPHSLLTGTESLQRALTLWLEYGTALMVRFCRAFRVTRPRTLLLGFLQMACGSSPLRMTERHASGTQVTATCWLSSRGIRI